MIRRDENDEIDKIWNELIEQSFSDIFNQIDNNQQDDDDENAFFSDKEINELYNEFEQQLDPDNLVSNDDQQNVKDNADEELEQIWNQLEQEKEEDDELSSFSSLSSLSSLSNAYDFEENIIVVIQK